MRNRRSFTQELMATVVLMLVVGSIVYGAIAKTIPLKESVVISEFE